MLVPPGVVVEHYNEIGELPHFNPDLEDKLPGRIVDLRARVNQADGLLIACPEYARGIPGSFKNMLDWLVGSPDFPGKPVALFNTSPRASAAQAALKLVLETMSATLIPEACVTLQLLGKQTDPIAIANDPVSRETLRQALHAIVELPLSHQPIAQEQQHTQTRYAQRLSRTREMEPPCVDRYTASQTSLYSAVNRPIGHVNHALFPLHKKALAHLQHARDTSLALEEDR